VALEWDTRETRSPYLPSPAGIVVSVTSSYYLIAFAYSLHSRHICRPAVIPPADDNPHAANDNWLLATE